MHTFARMHGADKGLISILDSSARYSTVAASFGFGPAALETLRERGMGSSAMACIERARVVIEDTERIRGSRQCARWPAPTACARCMRRR